MNLFLLTHQISRPRPIKMEAVPPRPRDMSGVNRINVADAAKRGRTTFGICWCILSEGSNVSVGRLVNLNHAIEEALRTLDLRHGWSFGPKPFKISLISWFVVLDSPWSSVFLNYLIQLLFFLLLLFCTMITWTINYSAIKQIRRP